MKVALFGLLAMLALASSGCATMSSSEKMAWRDLRERRVEVETVKSPVAAGALNILPGIGNFYLASEDSNQIWYGIGNFLLWPASVLWGVPQAAIDAGTYNKKETILVHRGGSYGSRYYDNW